MRSTQPVATEAALVPAMRGVLDRIRRAGLVPFHATPGTAAQAAFPSRQRFANGFLLEEKGIDWFFDHAIAREQRGDWRFSPLQAEDLAGVAPACLIAAECDPLADENVAYADRLRVAGVALRFDLVRGVTHDFIKMGRALKEAKQAQQFAADALIDAWRNNA